MPPAPPAARMSLLLLPPVAVLVGLAVWVLSPVVLVPPVALVSPTDAPEESLEETTVMLGRVEPPEPDPEPPPRPTT